MTFQESARCPVCLEVGKLRFQYGNYCCDKCDQCWQADTLGHWMKAFNQGRQYQRDSTFSIHQPVTDNPTEDAFYRKVDP